MTRLTFYQALYPAAGAISNIVSWLMLRDGGLGLSPTDPIMGLAVMGLAAAIIAVGALGYRRVGAILLLVPLYFSAGAVWRHLNNLLFANWEAMYASLLTWCVAFGVNLYGAGIFLFSIVYQLSRRSGEVA